jgi:hypothetical protein
MLAMSFVISTVDNLTKTPYLVRRSQDFGSEVAARCLALRWDTVLKLERKDWEGWKGGTK